MGNEQSQPKPVRKQQTKNLGFVHIEPNPAKWFERGQTEEERLEELKKLSTQLDTDLLRVAFIKYAGPDEEMDLNEFERFSKAMSISTIAHRLWVVMDTDKSGTVTKDEFLDALTLLTQARAWLRFCPTCMFDNECSMCLKSMACPKCSHTRFCVTCWASHPGNTEPVEERK